VYKNTHKRTVAAEALLDISYATLRDLARIEDSRIREVTKVTKNEDTQFRTDYETTRAGSRFFLFHRNHKNQDRLFARRQRRRRITGNVPELITKTFATSARFKMS